VIAVLDTGVRAHPWLGVSRRPGGHDYETAADGCVQVDQDLQDAIYAHADAAVTAGDHDRRPIREPWDKPETVNPLVGELARATGHGSFISGIVRQVVPDATVLSIRIMHSTDIVNEGELITALALLAARVARAQDPDDPQPRLMIDAVSLSLGYYNESGADIAYSSGLRKVIDKLLDRGVLVVAAAGNNSSSRRFYPAAFAAVPRQKDTVPVVSVGAENPNGTRASFSDDGAWVTAWASGASVVSTFPVDVRGALMPAQEWSDGAVVRESLAPNDFRGGFALWSGTSFAAPALAARFLKALLAGAAARSLMDLSQAATVERALHALRRIGWTGQEAQEAQEGG
jgi:hypothetical protein